MITHNTSQRPVKTQQKSKQIKHGSDPKRRHKNNIFALKYTKYLYIICKRVPRSIVKKQKPIVKNRMYNLMI